MNKNLKEKLRKIIKKEGFYIALFLCICIVVTVGTISYKMLNNKNQTNKSEDINKELTLNSNDDNVNSSMQNAERVDNSQSNDKNKEDESTKTKNEKSTTVATSNKVTFTNPLDGVESRQYSYPTPVKMEEGVFRTIRGINLQSSIGSDVKSAADGVVEIAENSGVEEGVIVQIKHSNGLKTRYGNLDASVQVKKGDKVKANQVIGKVGETAKVFSKDIFGEFLNLQVIDANGEQVNPEKYFNFKTK